MCHLRSNSRNPGRKAGYVEGRRVILREKAIDNLGGSPFLDDKAIENEIDRLLLGEGTL